MKQNPKDGPSQYERIMRLQKEREMQDGLILFVRTFLALFMGIWCHFVHASEEVRFLVWAKFIQKVICLPTFVFVDCLFLWIAELAH